MDNEFGLMYNKYKNLSDREKKLIMLAAALILVFLLIAVKSTIPNIFSRSLSSKVESDAKKFKLLIPKITKLNELKAQAPSHRSLPSDSLFKYISDHQPKLEVINEDRMVITDLHNGQKVRIAYQAVGFDNLIKWLNDLHVQYGIVVEEMDIVSDQKIGYVRLSGIISMPT